MTPIWWLLAFVPGLVALYFLKLRRQDQLVSSTLLWRRTLEDLHVNAPFQRLRRSWLLLLQLLVLLGLIAAAWRPRLGGTATRGNGVILLVDRSASMGAREADGTRLDRAKREARAAVSRLGEGDRAALVAFASTTSVVLPLTGDRGQLERAIDALEVTALPTRLDQALELAHSLSTSLGGAQVRVIGDGSYGDLSSLAPEVKQTPVEIVSVGTPLDNVAITEVDLRRSFEAKGRAEAFALIESFRGTPGKVSVELKQGDELRDAREVELPARGSSPVTFDVSSVGEGILSIEVTTPDALPADNKAYLKVVPPRKLRAIVLGKANPWLDLALRSMDGLEVRRGSLQSLTQALERGQGLPAEEVLEADVLIFDREQPGSPADPAEKGPPSLPEPPLPALYFACFPPLGPGVIDPELKQAPVVIDWDRSHPVTSFLSLTDLYIEESQAFRPRGELRSLVDGDAGSLIATRKYYPPGQRAVPVVVVAFDLLRTNWPIGHYSFPIFFSNALRWLAVGDGARDLARVRSGEPIELSLPRLREGETAQFRSPSGKRLSPLEAPGGSYALGAPEEVGVYTLEVGGETRERACVALLNSGESDLTPRPGITFGDFTVKVQGASEEQPSELSKWCALAALLLCLLEWHVYNRRMGG